MAGPNVRVVAGEAELIDRRPCQRGHWKSSPLTVRPLPSLAWVRRSNARRGRWQADGETQLHHDNLLVATKAGRRFQKPTATGSSCYAGVRISVWYSSRIWPPSAAAAAVSTQSRGPGDVWRRRKPEPDRGSSVPPVQRGCPARSRWVAMPVNPATDSSPATASAWSNPCSNHSRPPGTRWPAAPRTTSPSGQAAAAADQRRSRLVLQRRQVRVSVGHIRRVADARSKRSPIQGSHQDPSRNSTSRPSSIALARATASAASLASEARTSASRRAFLHANAIAPLPVPRSSRRIGRFETQEHVDCLDRQVDQELRLRTGHEHGRETRRWQPVKLLAADDVGDGFAVGSSHARLRATRRLRRQSTDGRHERSARRDSGRGRGPAARQCRAGPSRDLLPAAPRLRL